jgi:hypothetical protein
MMRKKNSKDYLHKWLPQTIKMNDTQTNAARLANQDGKHRGIQGPCMAQSQGNGLRRERGVLWHCERVRTRYEAIAERTAAHWEIK